MTPKQLIERYSKLKSNRATTESHWQECADYFMPNNNNIIQTTEKGGKRNTHLLDNTGMEALFLLSSFVQGALFNPNSEWFEYTTGDQRLDRNDEARMWLQDSVRRMHVVINDSNFQTEVFEANIDGFLLGTSCLGTFEDDERVVRFKAEHIVGLMIEENHLGIIDRIYRCFKWTATNIAEHFGMEALSDAMKKTMEKDPSHEYEIIHGVYRELNGTVWLSQYVLKDEERELFDKGAKKTAMFQEFPYSVVRTLKVRNEVYGRSFAMNGLPDMKILNKMTETEVRGAQRAIDPPMQCNDDGVVLPLKTAPGSINFTRPGTDGIKPLFNYGQVQFGYEALAERRQRVKAAFFIDELKLVQQDRMTAEEVLKRTEQAGMLLGPLLSRYSVEFLPTFTDRVFNIMMRRGMFLPVPEVLSGSVLKAKYTSMIARTQRVQDAQNIMRTIEAAAPFIQMDPSVADNFDGDESVMYIAKAYNFPQEALRTMKEKEGIRQARAEAQQQMVEAQQQAQQAETAAKASQAVAPLLQQGQAKAS